jgi:two-component system, NarL family, nitrate/nitrite response regulator NarL
VSTASYTTPIRLYLLDDHALFREGLARSLAADPDFKLIGEQSNPERALAEIRSEAPDVLLLDYDLGSHSAEEFVFQLRAAGFSGKILLVTAGLPDREALQMIRAGVAGIFHKQNATGDLRRSIREIFEGKVLIDEHYLRKLVSVASDDDAAGLRLSEREKLILGFLIEGLANKEIAARLKVSESAVKAALQLLFNKTGVRTRSELVRVALERFRDEI